MVKTDKCMGVSQILGHAPGLTPKVYAYIHLFSLILTSGMSFQTVKKFKDF